MAVAPLHPVAGQVLFFAGLVVPFTVYLAVLMVPRLGALREITVAVLGLYPALVYRMSSPLVQAGYDEHQHEQSLMNLLHGSSLFSPNPLLKVSPFYPGLEILTGVGIRLTGLPIAVAASVVVLLCRLLLVLIIYQSALLVGLSRRGASLVVAFYAVSPEFYSFNSAFAYQTLALTLGLGGIFLLRRAQIADHAASRRLFPAALLVLLATVITHHVTSWMVLAFLIAWAAMSPKDERRLLTRAAIVMGAAVAIWTGALATSLAAYLGPIFSGVLQTAQAFVAGNSGFRSSARARERRRSRTGSASSSSSTPSFPLSRHWHVPGSCFPRRFVSADACSFSWVSWIWPSRSPPPRISARASVSWGTGPPPSCSFRSRCRVR